MKSNLREFVKRIAPWLLLTLIIVVLASVVDWSSTDLIYSGQIRIIVFIVVAGVIYVIVQILWSIIRAPKSPFSDGFITQIRHIGKFREQKRITAFIAEYDPDRFLAETDTFLKQEKLPKSLVRIASDNRAAAYFQKGELERAIEIWTRTAEEEKEWREKYRLCDDLTRSVVHHNLCDVYLRNNQTEQAREHYNVLSEMQHARNLTKAMKDWIKKVLLYFDAKFLMAEGKYGEALEPIRNSLQDENAWNKLGCHFDLAIIYEKLGDIESQKEHLEQVVVLGNKHYYAAIACDKLLKIR